MLNPKPPLPSWWSKGQRTTRVPLLASTQSTHEKDQETRISSSSTEEERGQKSPLTATSAVSSVVDPHDHHIMSDDSKNLIVENPPLRHVCSICGKSFGTHQALGGHKSIHRVIGSQAQPRQRGGSLEAGSSRLGGVMRHSCKMCGAIFGTGQQLGGHMRKHYYPLMKRTDQKRDIIAAAIIGHDRDLSEFNDGGSICEAVPMVSDGGAYVSSQGGGDVDQKPVMVTEEIDLELRLWFK